jgi:phosphatidylinositol phospholipase C delta
MQLNQAMFDGGTDQSGYVLKPEWMREIRKLDQDQTGKANKLERKRMTFNIRVVSAQQLMRPASLPPNRTLDPYVEVEVFHANDKRDKHDSMVGIPIPTDTPLKFKTEVVRENGFNPNFQRGDFAFNVTTRHPELVFVRWNVKLSSDGENPHDRNPTIATYTAKLSNLKQGYRTLPLLDSNGDQFLFSKLFCYLKVDPPEDVWLDKTEATSDGGGKFKNLGRNVFSRSSNNSKTSFEKAIVDGGFPTLSPQSTM